MCSFVEYVFEYFSVLFVCDYIDYGFLWLVCGFECFDIVMGL